MITYTPRMVNREDNRTPVMYDREIDALAHDILADYKPELLQEPTRIDAEHFLEQYLGADILYCDLYNDDPARPILALTAFTEGLVDVFDAESQRVRFMNVPARTIMLDNRITEPGMEGLALFTGLHEAGHLVLHRDVFETDASGAVSGAASTIVCRRAGIENAGFAKTERTPEDWREHQADYFAAAIAMPNATFRPFVHQFLRENGVYRGRIQTGRDPDLDILADDLLPEYIAETYGVSKRAARIKLRKGGFVAGQTPA